jgi:carboxylesterase
VGVRAAVLLLHGLGGSAEDLEPLGASLAARGFVVRAPRLPGHGAGWRELAQQPRQAWRQAAEAALFSLRHGEGVERVALVGYSLGGLLALDLAARFPVAALVLLAPALKPWSRLAGLLWALGPLARLVPLGERAGFLVAAYQVLHLMREVGAEGRGGEVPLLVVQGLRDRVVDPAAARKLAAREGARLLEVAQAGHDLLGEAQTEVVGAVLAFLEEVL